LFAFLKYLKHTLDSHKHLYSFLAVCVLFLSIWNAQVVGRFSFSALIFFTVFAILCMAYGQIFCQITPLSIREKGGLPFQFLCGFLLANSFLFILTLISPLGIVANIGILSVIGLASAWWHSRQNPAAQESSYSGLPGLLCVVISGIAATLWCSDQLTLVSIQGEQVTYRAWQDIFIHVREISAFSQAHGLNTISDIQISGAPAHAYHYASYMPAAAVHALTGTNAIETYASFYLPFGILLTGLAAFAFAASLWGPWAGFSAAAVLLLMPDAYQQGFQNRYLSYTFMQFVNLGGLYGVACAAIAWIFMLDGCSRNKYSSLIAGYILLAICLFYKAQIFVANAFLMMIYPCLFFTGLKKRWRLLIGLVFIALFILAVDWSQGTGRVPTLRLDGSTTASYLKYLLADYDPGVLKSFFTGVFIEQQHSKLLQGLYAVAMLLLSTLGLWTLAMLAAAFGVKNRVRLVVLAFPFLVVANYLVMSLGLAMNSSGIGGPYEIVNRPLVWAYFVVVVWAAGAGYCWFFGDGPPRSRFGRMVLAALVCVSLSVPYIFSKNLQTLPVAEEYIRYEQFSSAPLCVVKAAAYIRENSQVGEIAQDSEGDPQFLFTALTERQAFVSKGLHSGTRRQNVNERLGEMAAFKKVDDTAQIKLLASTYGLSWYLLQPESEVSWPRSLLDQAVFNCNGYRVYRFPNGAR